MAETLVKSLRATGAEWASFAEAAARAGMSVNGWCIAVLCNAARGGADDGGEHLAAAARTAPRPRKTRGARVATAKAVLLEAEAKAAHLAQSPAHTVQIGPKRPAPGAMLKPRPNW